MQSPTKKYKKKQVRKVTTLKHSVSLPKIRGLLNKTRNETIPDLSQKSMLKVTNVNAKLPALNTKIPLSNSIMRNSRRRVANKSYARGSQSLPKLNLKALEPYLDDESKDKPQKKSWILDGYMIMNKYGFSIPEEASAVVITKHNINDVFEDDMPHFTNLAHLNLQDNMRVPMFKLSSLTALRKLNLSFNKITDLLVEAPRIKFADEEVKVSDITPYASLQEINLSFNSLTYESLIKLRSFKDKLKILDLSANSIK